jgi:hypothetical protein
MNKILIVGHPQSGLQEVERLLRACGMAAALPSRREGFAPEQISEILCKAHSTPPLHQLGNDREVHQVDVAPVWQSLSMDLMLGNIDQPLWGWADPNAVHLLDYWLALDPSLHFILVYDRPHSVLTRTGLHEAAALTREALQQRLDAWSAYNAAVLGFHLRHPERCLLVQSEQVLQSAEASLQHVRARIDAPWKDRAAASRDHPALLPHTEVEDAKQGTQSLTVHNNVTLNASSLSTVVAATLLKDQPGSLALYEELQASADLPLEADLAQGEDPALGMEAWLTLVAQQENLQSQRALTHHLQAGLEQAEQLAQERQRLIDEECLRRAVEQANMGCQLAELQRARAQVEAAQVGTQQENELLLDQLHRVQEELERHLLVGQDLESRIQVLTGKEQLARKQLAETETVQQQAKAAIEVAGQQALQQIGALTSEIESLKAKPAIAAPNLRLTEENELLLSQLHQVQEDLERYLLENKRLKSRESTPQPLAKPSRPAVYGAADRVKKQLSYRLGATLIHNSRSLGGWLSMPWAVRKAVTQYWRELPQHQAKNLPPIHTYADAYEADRVRNHLSYRLGEAILKNARSPVGWLRMPFALNNAVKAFRKQQSR